jgi:uncharacterized membrane protein
MPIDPSPRLRDYSSVIIEILVIVLSVAPIFLLTYDYPILPDHIPVFLNLHGEVEKWATKSVASVFRVPAMAIDLQLLCLLMKYAVVHGQLSFPDKSRADYQQYLNSTITLRAGLWDLLRCCVGFKMCAESLSILFLGDSRFPFLKSAIWAIPWIALILALVGALFYGYRLLITKLRVKNVLGRSQHLPNNDKTHLIAGFLYYNRDNPSPLVERYGVNFANKWVYALIASLAVYPLLVFWPV